MNSSIAFSRPLPVVCIAAESVPRQAMVDLIEGARCYPLWMHLAFHDIRQRFRRSLLGPFWLTLSMGVLIGAMGFVFSTLFNQNVAETLPFIATGIIFWGLLTSCINEGTQVFIAAESFIRNVPGPVSIHFYRMMARNTFVSLFNMAIYVLVVIFFRISVGWHVVLFLPGLVLLLANAGWIALASAILSTRYRDMPQVISNLIQVAFYVSPVFWPPEFMAIHPAFVKFNPIYHLLAIVRDPLLGASPPMQSWPFCIVMAVVGFAVTFWLYRRAHARIAYWV